MLRAIRVARFWGQSCVDTRPVCQGALLLFQLTKGAVYWTWTWRGHSRGVARPLLFRFAGLQAPRAPLLPASASGAARPLNPSSINFSNRARSAFGTGADMIHPPKEDESQIRTQGNPIDSGLRSSALSV